MLQMNIKFLFECVSVLPSACRTFFLYVNVKKKVNIQLCLLIMTPVTTQIPPSLFVILISLMIAVI